MRKTWVNTFVLLALISSCKNTPIEKGEDCSIKASNVEFTKSLKNAKDLTTIEEGGKLIFKSNAKSDNFNDPDGKLSNNTAPILLLKVDNTKPFTFTTKVTPTFHETYDAGALYIYLNKTLWFKFAFERDERMRTHIVTVRTTETSDDNNHDVVDSKSAYMKISSDVTTVGYYYSLDKETWQLVRLFRNDYPSEIWVGISAQSPMGNGTSVTFEECSLKESSIRDFRMGI